MTAHHTALYQPANRRFKRIGRLRPSNVNIQAAMIHGLDGDGQFRFAAGRGQSAAGAPEAGHASQDSHLVVHVRFQELQIV